MIHARIARFDRLKVEFNWWQATFTRSMNNDMRGHAMTLGVPTSPNGSAPRCEHVDRLTPVTPHSLGCTACETRGDSWTALRICLTCGWVACSDDSPRGHARAHYRETDHPVAAAVGPGAMWRWCYVHGRLV